MRKIIPLSLLFFFLGLFFNVPIIFAGEMNALIKQDETFFLQDELKKAQSVIAQKDLAAQNLLLEKEGLKKELSALKDERDLLQQKFEGLQKTFLEREQALPDKLKQLTDPFQAKIDQMAQQQEVLKMTIEQKDRRINELSGDEIALHAEIDNAAQEKSALVAELKKVRGDIDVTRPSGNNRVPQGGPSADEKVTDLQARLTAEQTLTKEKIQQVQKPLEEKIASINQQLQAQATDYQKKIADVKALYEAKIKSLEGLLAQAREAAGSKAPSSK